MKELLDSQVGHGQPSPRCQQTIIRQVDDASHDFDLISHENCSYDTATGLNINVDEILNGKDPEKMSEEEYQQTFRVPVPGFKMLPLDDHAVLYLHVAAGEGRDGE